MNSSLKIGSTKVLVEDKRILFGFRLPDAKIVDIKRATRGADVAIFFENMQARLCDCTAKRAFLVDGVVWQLDVG